MALISHKKILSIIIILLIFEGIFVFFKNKKEEKIIKIGYQPYVVGHSNIVIAMKRLKLLEQKGYTPQYIPFLAGPPINEALVSGSLDAGFGGDMPTISILASGAKVKVLGAVSKSLRQAIVVNKTEIEEIKNVKDLIDKKVALVIGSSSHYFLWKILKENKVDPRKISILNMDVKDQSLALKSNQIDALVSWEFWPTKLEKENVGKILVEGDYSNYVYVGEDFIKRNPKAVYALVESLQQALEYAQKNFKETCEWVAQEIKENPAIICEAAQSDRIFGPGENIKVDAELIEKLKERGEFLFNMGLISSLPDLSMKIDHSFIDKVLTTRK